MLFRSLQQISVAESKIKERAEDLKKLIVERVNTLCNELMLIKDVRLSEMESEKLKTSDRELAAMTNFRKYLQEIKEKGSPYDIIQATSASVIREKAQELQNKQPSQFAFGDDDSDIGAVGISFIPTSASNDILNILSVGRIAVKSKGDLNGLYHALFVKCCKSQSVNLFFRTLVVGIIKMLARCCVNNFIMRLDL